MDFQSSEAQFMLPARGWLAQSVVTVQKHKAFKLCDKMPMNSWDEEGLPSTQSLLEKFPGIHPNHQ